MTATLYTGSVTDLIRELIDWEALLWQVMLEVAGRGLPEWYCKYAV